MQGRWTIGRAGRRAGWGRWVSLGMLHAGVIAGCATSGGSELGRVSDQSVQNAGVLGDSAVRLGDAAGLLMEAQTRVHQAAARERVAQALVQHAIDADRDAAIERVMRSADALRARLEVVPIDQRGAAARELSRQHPEVIDLAAGTAGFSPERVADDAFTLDALHTRIEEEPSAAVRAGLRTRRDALLDAYMPGRMAHEQTRAAQDALRDVMAGVQRQRRVAAVHASGLRDAAQGVSNVSAARAAISELIGELGGLDTPEAQERARRIDAALEAIARLGTR